MEKKMYKAKCTRCGEECEGFEPHHHGFYHCECDECDIDFCYDDYRSEYSDVEDRKGLK